LINFKKLHGNLRSKKDACLYRHEIWNYYATKKIRSKIKTHACRSEIRIHYREKARRTATARVLDGFVGRLVHDGPKL